MENREYNISLSEAQARQLESLAHRQNKTPTEYAASIVVQYLETQAQQGVLAQQVYDALQESGKLFLEYRIEDGAVIVRSPLRHRHRPALRAVATFPAASPYLSQLRLTLRDNSLDSLRRFQMFADRWTEMEQLNQKDIGDTIVEEGRITRKIPHPEGMPEEQVPGYLGAYIGALSRAAQLFMESEDLSAIERLYRELMGRRPF